MTDEIPTKASAYDSVSKLLRLEDGYWEQITMLAIKESMKRRRRYSVNQLLKLRPLDVIEREREDARAKYIAEQATKAAGGGESDAASADNDGDMMFDASTIDFDDTDR
jgi:hypothetical protein